MSDSKHWMARAFGNNKGALHRELDVPAGNKIPSGKLKLKKGQSARTKKRIVLAKTGAKYGGGGGSK